MGYRTRFQETEEFVEPRSLAGSNRKRRAKLDLGASDPRHRDRRLQPGFPGLFPLGTCSTPDTARRSGVSRRSSSGYCAQLSWDTSPSNASKPPTPAFTACSLSRPESEKTRCNTRSAPYPSAHAPTPSPKELASGREGISTAAPLMRNRASRLRGPPRAAAPSRSHSPGNVAIPACSLASAANACRA
jgi:hypothetical protein